MPKFLGHPFNTFLKIHNLHYNAFAFNEFKKKNKLLKIKLSSETISSAGANNNNNYQGRRGQSDYRRNGYRPYTPGPGRSGYRRNYNNSNDYKPNRSGYNGGPRYPEKTYGGNGPRYDQRQIQKLEEMLKEMKQQKFNGHVSNGQGTGLGNDGHQPLNSSVVLDAMDGSYQHQSQ